MKHWRALVVAAVFIIALVVSIGRWHAAHSHPQSFSLPPDRVTNAVIACKVWAGIEPNLRSAIGAKDINALYAVETAGGDQGDYASLMRWASDAQAHDEVSSLSSDLTNLEGEISATASGDYQITDLSVPAGAVDTQCQDPRGITT